MQKILTPEIKIAASEGLIARGCVALIGLDQIRKEAGTRWDRLKSSAYAHLEAVLRQKLGPADYFVQVDDLTFLVTMPAASGDEVLILCLRVAHELHTSFLGPCDISRLQVSRATGIEGDVLACEIASGPQLASLAAQALALPADGQMPAVVPELAALTAAAPVIRYAPMWDVQNEVITTYRCECVTDHPFGDASSRAQFRNELNSLLERIRLSTMTLATRLSAGERYLLSLPVTYELISSPVTRMEITAICRNLSSAMRPYMQFEISELPYGVPQSRLAELVGSLRPFCRGVWGHVQPRIASFSAFQGAGLQGIGLSFGCGALAIGEAEAEMAKMCAAAKRANLRTCVHQIPSLDILRAAREMKVNLISGELIGEPAGEPGPIARLPMNDIVCRAAGLGRIFDVELRDAG
ncbi:MAG TPA: hypothetical protein VMH86_16655 [Rhizomicrobium sp.]|nr:hypothetical protein [Rhizomicrobium sp.]